MDAPPRRQPLWADRDFLKLWIAQAISELGSRISREGIPLTALLVLHAGAARMGLLNALGGIAVLVFGLAAGVWIDRLRRRPVLIAADLGRAALLASIPAAALAGAGDHGAARHPVRRALVSCLRTAAGRHPQAGAAAAAAAA